MSSTQIELLRAGDSARTSATQRQPTNRPNFRRLTLVVSPQYCVKDMRCLSRSPTVVYQYGSITKHTRCVDDQRSQRGCQILYRSVAKVPISALSDNGIHVFQECLDAHLCTSDQSSTMGERTSCNHGSCWCSKNSLDLPTAPSVARQALVSSEPKALQGRTSATATTRCELAPHAPPCLPEPHSTTERNRR